jgi:hypothetical protein
VKEEIEAKGEHGDWAVGFMTAGASDFFSPEIMRHNSREVGLVASNICITDYSDCVIKHKLPVQRIREASECSHKSEGGSTEVMKHEIN